MAIICWPEGAEHGEKVLCALCNRTIAFTDATAGPRGLDGRLKLACNEHFYNPPFFIARWADRIASEQTATPYSERTLL